MDKLRPPRLTLLDFAGRAKTISSDFANWHCIKEGDGDILVLGIGSGTSQWPKEWDSKRVFWLDEPGFVQKTQSHTHIPPSWHHIAKDQAQEIFPHASVWFFQQALSFAPAFWVDLLGELFAKPCLFRRDPKRILLLGSTAYLLHQELVHACQTAGFFVIPYLPSLPAKNPEEDVLRRCHGVLPTLCLSVNFRGLDSEGRLFGLFKALRIPCAIWIVDNPWHILSAIKYPWWKEAPLFVTDPSFVPQLTAIGAKSVFFLPLAVAPHMWRPLPEGDDPDWGTKPPLFVGHSAFPDKKRYFAAAHVDPALLDTAKALLDTQTQPDIHWWYAHCQVPLWPGNAVRTPGAGAEYCTQAKKVQWLSRLAPSSFTLVGDNGWKELLPDTNLHKAVDYYTELPTLYWQASCVLTLTSLQLPGSLNQRHFDVWAAGGFLFSNPTTGLSLFPKELTDPITIASPSELATRLKAFQRDRETRALIQAWRTHLAAKHTYRHRLQTVIDCVASSQ
ncbi:MAG: glycosyltransferase [Desulfovibrio sp.]|nr:glycosyltransferase [Desulfovibrio sp.]